jgi:hypothetical protein
MAMKSKKPVMKRFWKTVLLTGLLVGTTDILYAFISIYVTSGRFPDKMFRYIAGAAVGMKNSQEGGVGMDFLGLFFHYFIALSYTTLFFLGFPRIRFLSYNKFLIGILYGIFVNLTMKFLVLPLSRFPTQPFELARTFIDWIIFGIVFGIPMAISAYRYFKVPDRYEPA